MKVLENGYINLIDVMGDDLRIVNAARKSFGSRTYSFGPKEKKLLKYLWDNQHTSPFEMVEFMFEVKAPLFVVRQWQRHRTWSYNEVSRRYTSDGLDFYVPEKIRTQAKDNKQASDGFLYESGSKFIVEAIKEHNEDCLSFYENLIN